MSIVLPEDTVVLAWWSFVKDTEESWVLGEVLLRSDGALLRRFGSSFQGAGQTMWRREATPA